jgi:hypothetical protein
MLKTDSEQLIAKSFGGSGFRFSGFFFSIFWGCSCLEGMQQPPRDARYLLDCAKKRGFICLGRLVEAGDFSYELQGSCAHLFVSDWWIEIEERFDVSAHR